MTRTTIKSGAKNSNERSIVCTYKRIRVRYISRLCVRAYMRIKTHGEFIHNAGVSKYWPKLVSVIYLLRRKAIFMQIPLPMEVR